MVLHLPQPQPEPMCPLDIYPSTLPRADITTQPIIMLYSLPLSPCYHVQSALTHNPLTGSKLFLATSSYGTTVIIKASPYHHANPDNPQREIAAFQLIPNHPRVVPLLDSMHDENFVYMVQPYLSGGDLFSKVESAGGKGIDEDRVRHYIKQAVQGLLHMKQTAGIAHMDVSLENMMLDEKGDVKIIDLGMCIRVPSSSSPCYLLPRPCRGKLAYISPELWHEKSFDPFAADIWSLGVCIYSMLVGRHLYANPSTPAFVALSQGKIADVLCTYERVGVTVISARAKNLVCSMIRPNPRDRPTLEQVLDDDFFLVSN
jgi:serine/threonine protein kinase